MLQKVKLLDEIKYERASGTYFFGDSTRKTPCFRLLQVPPFYKKAGSKYLTSLLVFAIITAVDNEFVLPNEKVDLSALEMKTQMASLP